MGAELLGCRILGGRLLGTPHSRAGAACARPAVVRRADKGLGADTPQEAETQQA